MNEKEGCSNAPFSLKAMSMESVFKSRELVLATKINDLEKAELLLQLGFSPSDDFSRSLKIAILDENIEMLSLFVRYGYSPNKNNSFGYNLAVKENKKEVILFFFQIEPPSLLTKALMDRLF